MKIMLCHYGAFRKLGDKTTLDIEAPVTIADIRDAMVTRFGEQHKLLIEESAVANDAEILPDEFIIDDSCTLSVLPPVCGG